MIIKRQLKTLNNKTGSKIKQMLVNIINYHDKYKNCYFWTSTGNANSRRQQEFANQIEFNLNGISYIINQSLNISCKNFYYNCDIRKNGKKSNIKSITKLVN